MLSCKQVNFGFCGALAQEKFHEDDDSHGPAGELVVSSWLASCRQSSWLAKPALFCLVIRLGWRLVVSLLSWRTHFVLLRSLVVSRRLVVSLLIVSRLVVRQSSWLAKPALFSFAVLSPGLLGWRSPSQSCRQPS